MINDPVEIIRAALVEAEKHHSARASAESPHSYMAKAWADRAAADRRALDALSELEKMYRTWTAIENPDDDRPTQAVLDGAELLRSLRRN
jgi:hypothetical protein